MAKRCLSCKRDIADGQKSCFVCGSSQNLLVHYSRSGLLLLVVIVVASAISYHFISKANQDISTNLAKLEAAQSQIEQAEEKATEALNQLKALQSEAQQEKSQDKQDQVAIAELQGKITAAENKAVEAQKNVNWLAKQNNQLKTEVQSLTEQLNNAQQNAQPSNQLSEAEINQRIEQAKLADAQTIQSLRQQLQQLQQQLDATQTTDN